ncbi:MAG TPA: tetratricopeptide repeat protein, partial [Kofleriaceae bacterium]
AEPEDGIQLQMVEVVLDGLRETAVEDLARLARLDAMAFELTERGRRLEGELRRAFGDPAIDAIASRATIGEIERAFGDRAQDRAQARAEARIAVDALLMCDAIAATVSEVGLGAGASEFGEPSVTRAPARPSAGSELFDLLFDDLGFGEMTSGGGGAVPIEFDEGYDSGVVSTADVEAANLRRDDTAAARQLLAAEHQRIQNADHYTVLLIGRRARPSEIEAAFAVRCALLDRDSPVIPDPRDRAKLDELRRVYQVARDTLLDEAARSAYDHEIAGGELATAPPGIDAELAFRAAEELMARGQWAVAVGQIKTVITRSPGEADYHAALGWAEWRAGGESPEAADTARPHLNQALAINPDHAAAHDYKGRISAALRSDDTEALFHLERALELDPQRGDAIAAAEQLLIERGELRRYEKLLKQLLFRLRGKAPADEVKAWLRLAELYFDQLDDAKAGAAAMANARQLTPDDPDVQRLSRRASGRIRRDTLEPIRAEWRDALADPQSGAVLVKSA